MKHQAQLINATASCNYWRCWCWRRSLFVLALAVGSGWSALAPSVQAVSPPPDGGYSNANTAEGTDALFSLTTASQNTAVGLDALHDTTAGGFNTATGAYALESNTTGAFNTAIGSGALSSSLTASQNTAVGFDALLANTSGTGNTASGYLALWSNTGGTSNTGLGSNALASNTTGSRNVAVGLSALAANQTGIDNTATGVNALAANTSNYNTATGYQALESNTTGTNNTAHGLDAMNSNTVGSGSTANGAYALFQNTFGNNNTASGYYTLYANTTGLANTANGGYALYSNINGSFNVADGWKTLYNNTSGADNIAIGNVAGFNLTTGSDNIEIGNEGLSSDSGIIRIGNQGTQVGTYIAGIRGVAVAGGQPVAVSVDGQLGVRASAGRFKEAVKPMDKESEAILALRPVTFRYKKELDPKATPQFGLVAEEVAKIDPDLVLTDKQGKPFTVRYEEVNAMLLNEFLKEHRKVEAQAKVNQNQEATIGQLKSALEQQQKKFRTTMIKERKEIQALAVAVKEQAAQIHKVTGLKRIEAGVSASEMIADN